MEIELRAKLDGGQKLIDLFLVDTNYKLKVKSDERDVYFKIITDLERKLVIRIRYTDLGAMLTFKAKATSTDTAWQDVDTKLDDPEALTGILLSCGFEQLIVIEKQRTSFGFEDFEINIDFVKELGWFIEIEGRGSEESRESVEYSIRNLMTKLGIGEEDIINKGYVPLMLQKKGL